MKKLRFALCILFILTILALPAQAAVGSVDLGDVIQMGDFEGKNHYIVFYPKALESSDEVWPVAVWANAPCAPPLCTQTF